MVQYEFYGHACFAIKTEKETLLFDPFLSGNGQASIRPEDVKCQYILLSHAHSDHFGDAPEIAARTGAEVIAVPEVLSLFPDSVSDAAFHPMNLGGRISLPFGDVQMVPAMHSSGVAGGAACGFIIHFKDGPVVYYSGDTSLFSDMKLFGEYNHIDYAILPIGDNYTMGPEDALRAASFLKAGHVIPVHYNTWPVIQQDPEAFKKSGSEKGIDVLVVHPGETIPLK